MKIFIAILIIIIIVQGLAIFNLRFDLHQIKLSKDLWHRHAMATANWRMDHYVSDYPHLTKGAKE